MQIKTWWEESFTNKLHAYTQSPGSASSLLMGHLPTQVVAVTLGHV